MTRVTMAFLLCIGCSGEAATFECRTAAGCDGGLCIAGLCHSTSVTPSDLDAGPDDAPTSVSEPPDVPGPCAKAVAALPGLLVLNEVLANVPPAPDGDANGDGVRDAYEDEFVEIVSLADAPLDLSGLRISVNGKLKFSFEPMCLLPREAVVVFGGGSVGSSIRGSATVSQTRLSLPNDGGTIELTTADSVRIDVMTYTHAPVASLTRTPQLVGHLWGDHTDFGIGLFSPNRCANGASLADSCELRQTADAGGD